MAGTAQRIAIVGPGGAGKSTLARALGARTGLPVVHLDEHFWRPGWIETRREEWRLVQRPCSRATSGSPTATTAARSRNGSRAPSSSCSSTFPAWRTIPRVVRRVYARNGPMQAPGCPDRLSIEFLLWIARYRRRTRPKVFAGVTKYAPDARFETLRTPRAVASFLDSIPAGQRPDSG